MYMFMHPIYVYPVNLNEISHFGYRIKKPQPING